jgi:hypothetical protein
MNEKVAGAMKRKRAIILTVVLLLVAGVAAYVYAGKPKKSSQTTVTPQASRTPTPSPGTAGNPGDEDKSQLSSNTPSPTPTVQGSGSSGNGSSATPAISISGFAADNKGNGTIHVQSVVTGADENGICTLTLKSTSGASQTPQTFNVTNAGTYFSCSKTFTGIPAGTWTASLTVNQAGKTSNTATANVTVN